MPKAHRDPKRLFIRSLCPVLLVSLLSAVPAARAQCPGGLVTGTVSLVENGAFSSDNSGFTSAYRYVARHHDLPGGHYSVVTDPRAVHRGFATCPDHTGANGKMLAVNGTNVTDSVVWQQSVKVKPETTYYFSNWVAHITLPGLSPAKLQFSINGAGLDEPFVASDEPCLWKQFYTTWHSGSAREATISIVNQNTELHGNDFALDDVTFFECTGTDLAGRLDRGVEPGEVIALRKVFFDTDQTAIRPGSFPEIERLAHFLRGRPELKISVAGHTDATGSSDHNGELSIGRAKAVCEALQARGIQAVRCAFRGFGSSRPIDSNETYEGRQKNRRVEFSVVAEG